MDLRRLLLSLMIVGSAVCLVLGVVLPILKLTKLYVWTDEHSMATVIWALYRDGEYLLSLVIMMFSILIPGLKLVYLLASATITPDGSPQLSRFVKRLDWIGKWSMLDVLVLALVIFYVKTNGFADGATLPGVYFFSASVVLTMAAHFLLPHVNGGPAIGQDERANEP